MVLCTGSGNLKLSSIEAWFVSLGHLLGVFEAFSAFWWIFLVPFPSPSLNRVGCTQSSTRRPFSSLLMVHGQRHPLSWLSPWHHADATGISVLIPTALLSHVPYLQLPHRQVHLYVPWETCPNIPGLAHCFSYILVYISEPDDMLPAAALHPRLTQMNGAPCVGMTHIPFRWKVN